MNSIQQIYNVEQIQHELEEDKAINEKKRSRLHMVMNQTAQ